MLVLSRRREQRIFIDGNIVLTVNDLGRQYALLEIVGPDNIDLFEVDVREHVARRPFARTKSGVEFESWIGLDCGIRIGGNIYVKVLGLPPSFSNPEFVAEIKIGIQAPRWIPVHREEVLDKNKRDRTLTPGASSSPPASS